MFLNISTIRSSQKKLEFTINDQHYLKTLLLKEIDLFWSDYLESLNKIRALVPAKIYLPQDPQEAFFWETIDLFRTGFQQLNQRLQKNLYQ